MKRRLLMIAAPAAVAMLLAGCSQDKSGQLLGYWVRKRQNGRIQAMLRVQRDGQNLAITIAEFSILGARSQKETTSPLVSNPDLTQYGIQSDRGMVPLVAAGAGSAVLFKDAQFDRSTKEEYKAFLATVLPDRRF